MKRFMETLSSDATRNTALILIAIALWVSVLKPAPDLSIYGLNVGMGSLSNYLSAIEDKLGKIDAHLDRVGDTIRENTYKR